ncbi:hypothetical protein ACFW0H_04375 [Pseudomonas sp. CR3202]
MSDLARLMNHIPIIERAMRNLHDYQWHQAWLHISQLPQRP